ncbi:hypothetical protein VUJ49_07900 [Pseudomonas berkeleyensis]|uniref:Uncharacterized protein n=1 Tax=Pseudomonas berkeleyensis TaxID=2726956 RepID=A0A7G5DT93_9PSED|nr:hypothetical protein [Pseudomonas berkeleyensis]QMV64968.1 hypothetical protein HS968_07865 [Pseudomonas berkeleyensis]WSO40436.1 hypothetical protein VUJ49_07900 [Pseudomonas berkeleyensis]
MKTSLTTGEWGSFTAPRSRALGGKSGMTRAKPLVLIQTRPLHFADCLHLVFLALLSAFLWYASLPPFDRPQVPAYVQEQPCLIDRQDRIEYPEHWMERKACEAASARTHAEARGARARDGGVARMSERRSGSVQNEGASEARASR